MNETNVQRKAEERYRIGRKEDKLVFRTKLYYVNNTGKLLNKVKVKMQYAQRVSQQSSSLVGLFVWLDDDNLSPLVRSLSTMGVQMPAVFVGSWFEGEAVLNSGTECV